MNAFAFDTDATRESARARIGLQGPAGSGKTKTALRLAEGFAKGGTIGLADTERRSALKYAPVPGRPDLGGHAFKHLPMDHHDPRHLIQVVQAAEAAKLAVLVVDSWSHFWNGRGGLLSIVDETGAKAHGGNFGAWKDANPIEQDMLDALLNFSGHLIVTMRTKNDYVIQGKTVTKVGTKAVQREGAEYELDVVMDLVEGTATVTKTRYTPLEGQTFHHPGPDVAEVILDQLGQGVDPVQVLVDAVMAEGLTYEQALELHAKAAGRRLLGADLLHPTTSAPTKLGDLIVERGREAKTAAEVTDAAGESSWQGEPARQAAAAEQPKPAPEAPASGGPAGATPPQMRMMHALFNQLHCTDRDARLRATSLIVGRDVPSANDLTAKETGDLLDVLNEYAAREDDAPKRFAEMVDGLAQAQVLTA